MSPLDVINDWLFIAEGIHLSCEGTEVTVENFESVIMEIKRVSFSICISAAMEENLMQSEVVCESVSYILMWLDMVKLMYNRD